MTSQILIAEDEPALRDLLIKALEERSISVIAAADGAEALELLTTGNGIQLLLSDVKMPKMNGYELVELALGMRPELKVMMMTGFSGEFPPAELLRAREIRTLNKPFDIDHMCDLAVEMLSRP